jgi:predicted Rossmann fold flavoprotein
MPAALIKTDVCVIGAGPAGLFASIAAAEGGAKTLAVDRNATACRKLMRTGRGRCNLTHTGSVAEFVRAYGRFGRFLRHSLHEFSADDLRKYLAGRGLQTKVEKGGCVFPVTDRAGDVARVLVDHARNLSVRFLHGRHIRRIDRNSGGFTASADATNIRAGAVIIATGGVTWPFTGSTGDGYMFAESFGHKTVEPRACLSPLITAEKWPGGLGGVAIPNVVIRASAGKRRFRSRGPLMFTGDGIGGPAVFDLSRLVTDLLPTTDNAVKIAVDLMPEHEEKRLDRNIVALCSEHPKKELAGVLARFLPRALMLKLCERISPSKTILAGMLQKRQRMELLKMLKRLPLSVVAAGPIAEATVTRGGVSGAQINPKTMESMLCPGLFFAGEVINADGPSGGYNLQIAFSTGHLAGKAAASCL